MNLVLFFIGLLTCALSWAAWKGGAPERWATILYAAAIIASELVSQGAPPGQNFTVLAGPLLIVDLTLAIALSVLTIKANRLWLIPATGCQWLAVAGHLTRWLAPRVIPTSYAFLTMIWSWPMIVLLLIGTIAHQRRATRGEQVPGWRRS